MIFFMKNETYDVVLEDLIENTSLEELEYIFKNLNVKNVFIAREIKNKEDFKNPFLLPKSKIISFKKVYLLKEPSLLHNYKEQEIVFVESLSLKNNSLISNNKKIGFLKDPISEKLSFDEQNARSCFENKIKVVFNINRFRNQEKNSSIKQATTIINLLKIHSVDMVFASFAKNKEDLVSIDLVLFNFLKNLNLEESTIKRFLSVNIFK